ncbi:hypothetical protein KP509_24G067700 [Ceratopteris richardii]|uniref:Uncharacterized protein n=1 Tax=Ceratopteris richardii TaxID=49495 RepID=A0A8T2RXX5_CERRI|nr:hypothetical protein KP509_24G067700 [Ceratopteris richardii]
MQQRRSSGSIPRLVPRSSSSPPSSLGPSHRLLAASFDFKRSTTRKWFRATANSFASKELQKNIWDSSDGGRCSSVDLCLEAWKPQTATQISSYHKSADVTFLDCSQQSFPFLKVSAMQNKEHIRNEGMLHTHKSLAIGESKNKQMRWFTACAMAYSYVHGHQAFLQVLQQQRVNDHSERYSVQQYIHECVEQHEPRIPEGDDLCDLSQITATTNIYWVNPQKDRGECNAATHDDGEDLPEMVEDYSVPGTWHHANSSVIYVNDKNSIESNRMDAHCPMHATTDNPITPPARSVVPHHLWQGVDKNSSSVATWRDSVNTNSKHETYPSSSYTENEVIGMDEIVNPTQAAKWFGSSFLCTSALVS